MPRRSRPSKEILDSFKLLTLCSPEEVYFKTTQSYVPIGFCSEVLFVDCLDPSEIATYRNEVVREDLFRVTRLPDGPVFESQTIGTVWLKVVKAIQAKDPTCDVPISYANGGYRIFGLLRKPVVEMILQKFKIPAEDVAKDRVEKDSESEGEVKTEPKREPKRLKPERQVLPSPPKKEEGGFQVSFADAPGDLRRRTLVPLFETLSGLGLPDPATVLADWLLTCRDAKDPIECVFVLYLF